MKTLFSCLFGSALYGTATPESDVDWKHVVLPELDELLLGASKTPDGLFQNPVKNRVKKSDKVKFQKNSAEDVDEEYIPLHVFARDFLGGQTYALELAYAVDSTHAKQTFYDSRFRHFCQELRTRYLTSDIAALVSYASEMAGKYSIKGERLNACYAALSLFQSFPPSVRLDDAKHMEEFEKKAMALVDTCSDHMELTILDMGAAGPLPCFRLLDKKFPYTTSFKLCCQRVEAMIKRYGDRVREAATDEVDWKATMHAVRILHEGLELLHGRKLCYPYPDDYARFLLDIREGKIPYLAVTCLLEFKLKEIQHDAERSSLPKRTPELRADLEQWLLRWLKTFYASDLEGASGGGFFIIRNAMAERYGA